MAAEVVDEDVALFSEAGYGVAVHSLFEDVEAAVG